MKLLQTFRLQISSRKVVEMEAIQIETHGWQQSRGTWYLLYNRKRKVKLCKRKVQDVDGASNAYVTKSSRIHQKIMTKNIGSVEMPNGQMHNQRSQQASATSSLQSFHFDSGPLSSLSGPQWEPKWEQLNVLMIIVNGATTLVFAIQRTICFYHILVDKKP